MTPLDAARHLAAAGVPIFVAKATPNKLGFRLPEGWEQSLADPRVVDTWKPGMALCAVTGCGVDAIDIDPRNGGNLADLVDALGGELPTVYGRAATPSGGQHLLIASLGVRKVQSVLPGIDIQAGNEEGLGRGFIFLAPTVREGKQDGVPRQYEWELEPNLDPLLLGDDSGAGLRSLVEAHHGRTRGNVNVDGVYTGPLYDELDEGRKAEADELSTAQLDAWRKLMKSAARWPDGHRDERGRGWEALARDLAWALAKMAACPWMSLDETGAELLYHELLPPELADNEDCAGKWLPDLVAKAAGDPVDVPPWVARGDVQDDFGRVAKPICDATNMAHAARWLDAEIGRGPLSGLFLRGEDLIYTPRVGEEGYVEPDNPYDHEGPAQVRRVVVGQLAKRVDNSYRVVHMLKRGGMKDVLFPREAAERSMALLEELPNLKTLTMVTHTPIVRADGTVLDQPGFDEASRTLYLPQHGLVVPTVPDVPTDGDLAAAGKLLSAMVQDFPFVSEHDRANYLGSLLIPLLRAMVPPPYKMLIIGAPQRGSGKSLLALLMRIIHGGVFRSEIPNEEDERRKVITSILDSTSAPVVQFDNLSGALRSSVMDGLLTSAEWSDRRLGLNVNLTLKNDRLWIATGNNIHLGGDLERRVLWCTINAQLEKPELRPAEAFHIPNLEQWTHEHRGELIWAMLVMIRAWAVAGMPVESAPTSDSFGRMTSVLRGVLAMAGVPGELGHSSAAPVRSDPDAEELAEFLRAVNRVKGERWWTVRELLDAVSEFDDDGMRGDELPLDLGDKLRNNKVGAIKSLGKWLSFRADRLSDGLMVQTRGGGNKAMEWRVVRRDTDLLG